MGTDSSLSSSTTAPAAVASKSVVVKTVAQHHRAVVGFLLGFFLVMVLYTAVTTQFGSRTAIIGVLQSTPAARAAQNARTAPTSPSSTPSDLAGENSTKEDNGQRSGTPFKTEEERVQHDAHHPIENNNQTKAKIGGQRQPVNDAIISDPMEEEIIRQEIDEGGNKNDSNIQPVTPPPREPICDLSDPRYDICEISGDARALGANRTVLYVPPASELAAGAVSREWSIRDQSRKHLEYVGNVTVRSLNASEAATAPACTSRLAVPAVVFAMNGLTSNPWHDFSDVLIPLFLTTRAMDGEVQLLVTDLQPWFVDKYRLILRNLSRHDIVDLNRDAVGVVRCHPRLTVGLRSHRDLGIDPARAPRGYTMLDFRLYVRDIYSLPPDGVGIPYKAAAAADGGGETRRRKPRMMLINRGRTRKFVNFPEVVAAAEGAGFEVIPVEPRRGMGVEEFSRSVDSCDVLMGAHGAGLTNFFFLRTGAVMLQVVPWGHMEHSSMVFYGGPAREMRLRDVEYSIAAVESTLYDKYGGDDPVVSDPESIHRKGWQFGMRYYWIEQDIRLNVSRFAPTLQEVLRMIKE